MSTDQQQKPTETPPAPTTPAPTQPAAPNPIAERLSSIWQDIKSGKILSYRMMAGILILAALIGLGIYLWVEGRTADSAKWVALDKAGTKDALEKYIKDNGPDTTFGRVARLHLARYKLGPEGIEALNQPGPKQQAIESIKAAQEDFRKLAEEFKDEPAFKAQCYYGLAKGEAALLGLDKYMPPGSTGASVEKLIEYLDKLGEIDEKTPWCAKARDLSAALKDKNRNTRDEIVTVQRELYDSPSLPGAGDFGGGVGPGPGPIQGIPGGHPKI
jgi:hypothetical protein